MIGLAVIVGLVITLVTGFINTTPSGVVGATWYGWPFPWRIVPTVPNAQTSYNGAGLSEDVFLWCGIGLILALLAKILSRIFSKKKKKIPTPTPPWGLSPIEINKMVVLSVAKIGAALGAVMGFFVGIFMALIGTTIMRLTVLSSTYGILFGAAAIVILPVVFAVVGFIGGLIVAFFYNVIAEAIGGIEMGLGQK